MLPGVTIEAASPVLIEKTRTAVSDGTGQYRLENLAPGTYTVTYTLTGFSTVQRSAVDIQTGVTVTLNTEMRVGAVAETITVTGETPVVDIQNSTRVQKVLTISSWPRCPRRAATATCWRPCLPSRRRDLRIPVSRRR